MRSRALIAIMSLVLLSPGCNRGGKERSETRDAVKPSHRATSDERAARRDRVFGVGMILDVGGRGDHSVNDSAIEGLERARKQLEVVPEIAEPKTEGEREATLRMLAQKDLDLIITIGAAYTEPVKKISSEFPDRRFVCVDYVVPPATTEDSSAPADVPFNVRALLFREEEGGFLVGALAGWTTRTGRIGFVGAAPGPATRRLEKSFTAGVRYANPRAEVGPKYVVAAPPEVRDPARAREVALELYAAGADIILQAAGASGMGVFEAAKERERYVIGTDTDQASLAPGLVLTSIVKHVDRGVLETIKAAREGSFKGGVTRMGMLVGGVEIVLNEDNEELIPRSVRSRLEGVRRGILGRQISIPTGDETETASFPR